jgi:hypothetical protein
MKIRPHTTMNDLDRYGPLSKLPLPLSSPAWEGAEVTADDAAALRAHFRDTIAPLIEAKCTHDPACYLEILASLAPHLFTFATIGPQLFNDAQQ